MIRSGSKRSLDEELRFHFEETVDELMAKGMSREDAEREARKRFGDERRYRSRIEAIDGRARRSEGRRIRLALAFDALRDAVRSLRRAPALTAGIVGAFALGIGANATMYGTLDRILLRPPDGIRDPDRVVRLQNERWISFMGDYNHQEGFTYVDLVDQRAVSAFEGVATYAPQPTLTVGHGADARQIRGVIATANYWDVLGVGAELGRFFTASEDVRGGATVAVISHGLWTREFGGSEGAVGQLLEIGDGDYEIVGVAPKGFTGVDLSPVDVWLPLNVFAANYPTSAFEDRNYWWVMGVARLAPGLTTERAEAEASGVFTNGRREVDARSSEGRDSRIITASLIAAAGPAPAKETVVAKWLAAVSAIVLLIACANVANLLLARGVRQQREVAVRLALGSSRTRLVGQTLIEGLLLALLGAGAALGLTWWGGGFVRRTLLPDIDWGPAVTTRLLLFVLGVTVLAGLVSTVVPAWQAAGRRVGDTLRRTVGGVSRSVSRTRAVLSVVQASFSVVLLVGAGLFLRSLGEVNSVDLGFDAERTLVTTPILEADVTAGERAALFEEAIRRLEALPGIGAAASAEMVPFRGAFMIGLRAEGVDSISFPPTGGPYIYPVSPGYFDALGMRIMRGRGFEDGDVLGAPQVAVVSESMAELLWPGGEPLGKCLHTGTDRSRTLECTRIVGVVADSHRGGIREGSQYMYWVPEAQEIIRRSPSMLVAHVEGDFQATARAVSRELLAADPRIRFARNERLADFLDPQLRSWTLGATMFTLFGALALVVAAMGLYSVLAFDVAQRTREIGLRSALGAGQGSILRRFLGRSLVLAAFGTVVGLGIAATLSPRIEALLFEVSPRDPLTFSMVATALMCVAGVAGIVPAWRAARVDPNVALRTE